MRRKKISNADIAGDYLNGMSMQAIAHKYARCRGAILYRLRRYGISSRRAGAPRGNSNARRKP